MFTENLNMALPFLIFFARIIDVSIGTIRIIVVSRGMRLLASLLGFMEVFIWLAAISQIIKNLSSWEMFFFYSAGFACGTFVGMTIERKLSFGNLMVRIVSPDKEQRFRDYLVNKGYRVTYVEGEGVDGHVSVMFSIIKKNKLKNIINAIREFNPKAFYTVEDVRVATNGATEFALMPGIRRNLSAPFYWFRKGK